MPILDIRQVTKYYGDFCAVNALDMSIPEGAIFGLLGPNGAGKTSLIRMITGITRPDQGNISLLGMEVQGTQPQKIGYLPEERGLYKRMKVGEQLLYLSQLRGCSKAEAQAGIDEWVERFDIGDWLPKKVEELSKGMQQKVQFISTVMHRPPLLILDEPFSGLDPINTQLIQDEILRLNEAGTTILFSTHRMEQVETFCEHIALVNQGRNILSGRVEDIREANKKHQYLIEYRGNLPEGFLDDYQVLRHHRQQLTLQVDTDTQAEAILRPLLAAKVSIRRFEELLPSLQEVFISTVQSSSSPETSASL